MDYKVRTVHQPQNRPTKQDMRVQLRIPVARDVDLWICPSIVIDFDLIRCVAFVLVGHSAGALLKIGTRRKSSTNAIAPPHITPRK